MGTIGQVGYLQDWILLDWPDVSCTALVLAAPNGNKTPKKCLFDKGRRAGKWIDYFVYAFYGLTP